MNFKKICFSLLICCSAIVSGYASCYSEWIASYQDAEEELSCDIVHCQYSSWVSRCNYEAKLSYASAIDTAGQEYYDCVNRR